MMLAMPPLNESFLDELVADPEKFRRQWDEEAKRENPDMTQEQLDAAWQQLAQQFGL
jgi:hypothetical protein